MKYLLITISMMLTMQVHSKQRFYKWTDAKGVVHFSEHKPESPKVKDLELKHFTPEENIISDKVDNEEEKSESNVGAKEKTKEQLEVEEYNKKERKRVIALQNKKNCEIAKKNLSSLKNSTYYRIGKSNTKADYANRQQRKKLIESANKTIKKLCK